MSTYGKSRLTCQAPESSPGQVETGAGVAAGVGVGVGVVTGVDDGQPCWHASAVKVISTQPV